MPNFYKNNDYILTIQEDMFAINPREEAVNSKFYTFLKSYSSPDEHNFSSFKDFMKKEFNLDSTNDISEDFDNLVKEAYKQGYALCPVYICDHSSVSYSLGNFNDPWDSSICGVIYEPLSVANEITNKDLTLEDVIIGSSLIFKDEINDYNCWLVGDVYEVYKYDYSGEVVEWSYPLYGMEQAQEELDSYEGELIGDFTDIDECLLANPTVENLERKIKEAEKNISRLKEELKTTSQELKKTKDDVER